MKPRGIEPSLPQNYFIFGQPAPETMDDSNKGLHSLMRNKFSYLLTEIQKWGEENFEKFVELLKPVIKTNQKFEEHVIGNVFFDLFDIDNLCKTLASPKAHSKFKNIENSFRMLWRAEISYWDFEEAESLLGYSNST